MNRRTMAAWLLFWLAIIILFVSYQREIYGLKQTVKTLAILVEENREAREHR